MTRDTHYDLEILAELAEGLLDDATARGVREHLAVCDSCGESLADLAAVREVLAAVPAAAMPLGVAMRIDRALAAEAAAPDWDRIMSDAPWETVPEPEPVPVPLGVVTANGSIVPAQRKKPTRRRPWAMPVSVAAAAAAVVISGTAVATGALSGLVNSPATIAKDAPKAGETAPVASPSTPLPTPSGTVIPSKKRQRTAAGYSVYASGHNYTSRELNGPLLGYFGVAPVSGTTDDDDLDKCVKRFSAELDRKPIGVDKANYNGNDATIMAFWEDQSSNAVRVVVVDSDCALLRPESLSTWN